jgi:hypothetical protein
MALKSDAVLQQIDSALSKYSEMRKNSQYDDCSDFPEPQVTSLITTMCSAIERFAPANSHYAQSMRSLVKEAGPGNSYLVPHIAGILSSLRSAYQEGFLASVVELVHADVFGDFIEMAEYLLNGGFKDPAAVIVGSVLEEHLRQLCVKVGVPIDVASKPKKADALNADLAGNLYTKLDQKSVTAWLDLRNKAAHGKYAEYTKEQVALMLQGVRDFIARNPA